jgi:hypothetical protein
MKKLLMAAVAAVGLSASSAQAALELSIIDNLGHSITDNLGSPTVLADNGAGWVFYQGQIGSFRFVMSYGFDEQKQGVTSLPSIHLNTVEISATDGNPGWLRVGLTQTGLSGLGTALTFTQSIGGAQAGDSSVQAFSYVDPSDTAFGSAVPVADLAFGQAQFSGAASKTVTVGAGSFSMTEYVHINVNGITDASFDSRLSVPEPASLLLAGGALMAFGLVRRRWRV